ncbi:hypothetical protein GDO81_006081 [Engystomops pustulosus]|uniref:ZP domain-containing protein n=1 Tax=Engystomops pustulosus TaxID=76066 RepID=A0AAV7CUF5_ENGPU|nr:hypothetical protein GDO81_006081 [Engystomops pustulosus]
MKVLLALLLALCSVLTVHAVTEQLCDASVNCTCDPTKYNTSVVPPNVTVSCPNGVMVIYISKCQLEKNLFNSTNLSLSNFTGYECASREYIVDGEIEVGFHNPLNSAKCGNNVTVNSTHVIYSNILYIYAAQRDIISRNNYTQELSCVYPLIYPVKLNVTLTPIVVTKPITVPGVTGQLEITMGVFIENTFTVMLTENAVVNVEDTLYIRVWMPTLEADTFSIKVIRIYATPGGTGPQDGMVFNLTSGFDGCPDPQYGIGLISVLQNGNGTEARFAMKVFKITNQDYVKLFADVTICPSACPSNCKERAGKSYLPDNVASLSVELTASDNLSSGATDCFSMVWTLVSLISSLLFAKYI